MGLSKLEIDHIARLARLELTEMEKDELTGELNELIGFLKKLDGLETRETAPAAQAVPVANVLRPDMIGSSLEPDKVLANAPDRMNNFFKVPKILEG